MTARRLFREVLPPRHASTQRDDVALLVCAIGIVVTVIAMYVGGVA